MGWIREWRLQAVKNYDDAFEIFRQYEMETFGDKSFFANLDSNREKPEIDHGDAISVASGMPHHAIDLSSGSSSSSDGEDEGEGKGRR